MRGARTDLHSGLYGGAVANPIHTLAQILASLRDAEGRIAVAGFYDRVTPLSDADRAQIAAVPFDEAAYREQLGVPELVSESGYTPQEHLWARPTLEVNGIWGGFQGAGGKTVLPAVAGAKITCRLVPEQEPDAIRALLVRHIERQAPRGVRVTVTPPPGGARPYRMPPEHWGNRAAAAVLAELYGRPPYYLRLGATVPILDVFRQLLGAYSVGVGFGLEDEQVHAPNEFFRLGSFDRGQRAYARLFGRLGEGGAPGGAGAR